MGRVTIRRGVLAAPPSVLGTITDLSATALVESVRLDWTAAANATSHQPQYSDDGETWTNFGSALSGSATGVTVTGLTASVPYSFRVIASDGVTQTISNVDTATPTAGGGVAPLLVEDFSTYTSTADFINNPRGIYVPSEDYRLDRMTLDTSIGYGTSDRSLRYNYPAGTDTDYTISRALSIGSQQEVWVEAVVRFSTNFTTAGNGQGAGIGFKLLFVNIRDIPQGGRFGLHMEGSRLSIEGPNDDYTAMHVSTTLQIATLFDGNWHVLRYHVRLGATDFHELFYQGVSQGSASGNTSASELLRVSLARNLNMLAAQPQEMWWGRVSVWTTDPGWT